jgi:hypothetical protein
VAWHERQVGSHLARLSEIGEQSGKAVERLAAMLESYAMSIHAHGSSELGAVLHRGEHVIRAHRALEHSIRDVVAEGANAGEFRTDASPDELAAFCLHALGAATQLPSKAAVRRLVHVTMAGLRTEG